MSEKEIYAKIVDIIQEHDSSKLDITPELKLKEELGVDSVDLMEFIIHLEDAFEIEIPDDDMDDFTTISDVVAYIHSKAKKHS
ncbi:acyl carrier protein [Streptococcus panodentis]|uniref:Acyl carrier protein n=1 Tax=Streptococcus panodentis TaxID=1581472 RepID=A0ABS5AWS5_9STRE|nr:MULTISPECIES: acyl carrier protein [Streptococcus]KXT77622.1 Acyl carrier protein [Streptococcus sp. DD11]MBP2620955.1 acyl carrier protein [Streptococcus panodentis]